MLIVISLNIVYKQNFFDEQNLQTYELKNDMISLNMLRFLYLNCVLAIFFLIEIIDFFELHQYVFYCISQFLTFL